MKFKVGDIVKSKANNNLYRVINQKYMRFVGKKIGNKIKLSVYPENYIYELPKYTDILKKATKKERDMLLINEI